MTSTLDVCSSCLFIALASKNIVPEQIQLRPAFFVDLITSTNNLPEHALWFGRVALASKPDLQVSMQSPERLLYMFDHEAFLTQVIVRIGRIL